MSMQARALEETRDLGHVFVHVDMDAFYAAVEMRDNPEYVRICQPLTCVLMHATQPCR